MVVTVVETRRVEYVLLDEVAPAPRNPKRHDLAAVRSSIERFGVAAPALRDERTGRLVVGHGRTEALRAIRDDGQSAPAGVQVDKKGRWLVPVVCGWASRSDAEAEAYLVADNHHTVLGGWDHAELAELLESVKADDPELLDVVRFDMQALDDLLKASEPPDLDALADEVGEPQPSDSWPIVRVKVPPHVAAAWRSHVETHNGAEVAAFAALLEVDPDAPSGKGEGWEP